MSVIKLYIFCEYVKKKYQLGSCLSLGMKYNILCRFVPYEINCETSRPLNNRYKYPQTTYY